MARYRVGAEGLRVFTARGTYTLPPDALLDEIPQQYEGTLLAERLDEIEPKRLDTYADKMIRPAEDKSL